MFDQPEFIQPLTEPPKQPDPIAGLGEFLQIHLGDNGVCQHSCHPYLNQATKTSVGLIRLDRRTGLSAVG